MGHGRSILPSSKNGDTLTFLSWRFRRSVCLSNAIDPDGSMVYALLDGPRERSAPTSRLARPAPPAPSRVPRFACHFALARNGALTARGRQRACEGGALPGQHRCCAVDEGDDISADDIAEGAEVVQSHLQAKQGWAG